MSSFALEAIEKGPQKELKVLQLERLRWSLKHAYDNVPRYRRKFDAAGVKPTSVERVICGAGPGSFTSLRIAAGIAKGFALC